MKHTTIAIINALNVVMLWVLYGIEATSNQKAMRDIYKRIGEPRDAVSPRQSIIQDTDAKRLKTKNQAEIKAWMKKTGAKPHPDDKDWEALWVLQVRRVNLTYDEMKGKTLKEITTEARRRQAIYGGPCTYQTNPEMFSIGGEPITEDNRALWIFWD